MTEDMTAETETAATSTTEAERTRDILISGDGFTVLEGLITPGEAMETRNRVMSHIEQARDDGGGVRSLPDLIKVDPAFATLATNPRLLALARALMGDDTKLAAFSAKILNPDCKPGGLHIDYPYWALPRGLPVDPPLMLQVIWMMEPFTTKNGGTWVAPGSQHWTDPLDNDHFHQTAIQAQGNAGDAVVSHGMLWHRTAENHSEQPRVAVLINFTQLTIQPMTRMGPYDDTVVEGFSPDLRSLLGFQHGEHLLNRVRNLK